MDPTTRRFRILVVEDDFFVALDEKSVLEAEGWVVVGPATSLAAALRAAKEELVDCAFLDVNLNGEQVTDAAAVLAERGIPFTLVSAYARQALQCEFLKIAPHIQKPYRSRELIEAVAKMMAESRRL